MKINYNRNKKFSEQALTMLKEFYSDTNEDPQHSFARAAIAYSGGDDALAERIYGYASKRWFMYSSPILSNAPKKGRKKTGLPISCFLTYVGDTLESLINHNAEVSWLSVKGGGVGGHWSDVRAVSDKAPSPIPFLKVADSIMTAYKQGKTRKGSYAAYLDVSHPDIIEFLNIKTPTGGDSNRKCFNIFNAVNVTDKFMMCVENDNEWELVDPYDNAVRDTIRARDLWEKILETRFRTGSPYINFIDTANRALPQTQKDLGLKIHGSNLCNEIHLATDDTRTAVCCLSSVNLEKYDEWKDTNMVQDLIRFLDNVLQYFIDNAPVELSKAIRSAQAERSLGLGAMGFHSYLQKNAIPYESVSAMLVNKAMFAKIKSEAVISSKQLAEERGEPSDMAGTGLRNAHLLAIAPNANSSIICGTSPSIEPISSNAFVHRTRAGAHLIKNKYLERILESKYVQSDPPRRPIEDIWKQIIAERGSCASIPELTPEEREVFKTAPELDQAWSVDHGSHRQKYICQGQSINLFYPSGTPRWKVNADHLRAHKLGLKGLYYLRTDAGVAPDKVGVQVERDALQDAEECLSCQG